METKSGEGEEESWSLPFGDDEAAPQTTVATDDVAASGADGDAGLCPSSSSSAAAERAAALSAEEPLLEFRHPELGYVLTTDRARVNLDVLHQFLSTEAYWSVGISKARVALAVANSIPFSLLSPEGDFVGFCRINTDYVSFAYLSDVYVDKRHRKRGLSKWFIERILETDYVTTVRSVFLMTRSAQKLYAKFGFEVAENRCMVYRPGVAKDVGRYEWRLVEHI